MAYLLCIAAAAAKPTVLYRYFHLWNLTRDCIQLFFSLFYAGNCCQKPSGVRVAWIFEQFCTFSFFYYCTAIHYQHTVTDSGHYSHIMGYQYDCYSQLIPQLLQQGKDLGLIVTSNAVVGSSAISTFGLHANAMAIITLCCIPPDNS